MGGSGGGKSSSTTTASIAPELQPLFAQTGETIQALQRFQPGMLGPGGVPTAGPGSALDMFMYGQPQVVPQMTPGQMAILAQQRARAAAPMITPQETTAAQLAGRFGALRPAEISSLAYSAGLGARRPEEIEATALGRGFGALRPSEAAALQASTGFGALRSPEALALQGINYFTGGAVGQSPATLAAIESQRGAVQNQLAMAGLGTSGQVGASLASMAAPIIAQEVQARASVIPTLAGIGEAQRRGEVAAAEVQMRIGDKMREGDVSQAQNLRAIADAARKGDAQAADIQRQIGEAQREGDETTATLLAEQGKTLVERRTELIAELAQSEEAARELRAQQEATYTRDLLRRQGIAENLVTGVLGGFPAAMGQTTSTRGGGGK